MMAVAYSAQLFLLAGVSFLALGSVSSAGLVSSLRASLVRVEPHARHRALVWLAALPAFIAFALLLTVSLPSLVALIAPGADHCTLHEDGHAHLCFRHLPSSGISVVFTLCLVFSVSYCMLRAALALLELLRAMRVVNALAATGEERSDLGVTVLETTRPVCLAAGLLHPRVLLSRGLLDSLSPRELAVILAHERAHVRRRDAAIAGMVRVLVSAHLPWVKRWLLRELEIAAEQSCDEDSARLLNDRLVVAATILRVERAAHRENAVLGVVSMGFGAQAIERRVQALLSEPSPPRSLRAWVMGFGLAVAIALSFANELHHVTESVLSSIAS